MENQLTENCENGKNAAILMSAAEQSVQQNDLVISNKVIDYLSMRELNIFLADHVIGYIPLS